MRQSQKNNRARAKGGRKSQGSSINRVYESSGPEGKVRGTPQQIIDKYQTLARDKATSGDRVMAEAFLQYAEHYIRILTAAQANQQQVRRDAQPATAEGEAPQSEIAREDNVEGLNVIGGEPSVTAEPESLGQPQRQPRRRSSQAAEGEDEGGVESEAAPRRRTRRSAPRRAKAPEEGAQEEAHAPASSASVESGEADGYPADPSDHNDAVAGAA